MSIASSRLTPAVVPVEGDGTPEGKRSSRRRRFVRAGGFTPYALLTPALIAILVITGWPLVQLVVMSFLEFGRAQVFGAPREARTREFLSRFTG